MFRHKRKWSRRLKLWIVTLHPTIHNAAHQVRFNLKRERKPWPSDSGTSAGSPGALHGGVKPKTT